MTSWKSPDSCCPSPLPAVFCFLALRVLCRSNSIALTASILLRTYSIARENPHAIELLSRGETGVLVSRQGGRCVPIRFSDLIDPETERTRVRYVNVNSDTFMHARALQTRVEEADLADDSMVERLAQASGLAPAAVRERYALVR